MTQDPKNAAAARTALIKAGFPEANTDEGEAATRNGFRVRGVGRHHVRITTDEPSNILHGYAGALDSSGDWRDIRVVTSVMRGGPVEVLATAADAPTPEHLETRAQFLAFARAFGISSFHEIDESDVKARVFGRNLDTSGTWEPQRESEDDALYMTMMFEADGVDTAYVSLARMASWAAED